MADRPIIKLENVSKTYNVFKSNRQQVSNVLFGRKKGVPFKALDGIDLEIKKGENVGLLGNVGAGRTTLVKIISGITYPTEGKVKVDGKVMAVFDLRAGFDINFTGRDNIRIKGSMIGWNKKQIEEKEEAIIDFAEMKDIIDLKMSSYKPVDRSRLGLSMILLDDSDIMVYDGFLGVGTQAQRTKCIEKMREWKADEDRTFIMISAIWPNMNQLCDRGIVLDNGQIKFDGPFAEAVKIFREEYMIKAKPEEETDENDGEKTSGEHGSEYEGSDFGDF